MAKSKSELDNAMAAAESAGARRNAADSLSPDAFRRARTVDVSDAFPAGQGVAVNLGFVGSGQGGARMAQSFWNLGYRRVGAFNTTDTDFAGLAGEMPKLSLDIGGASKDTERAERGLRGRGEDVRDLLTRAWGSGTEWGLVCASLGGGTGSGTATALVEAARAYLTDQGREPKVGAVVSLPKVSEGQQQARNAVVAFRRLLEARVSPLVVVDNAKVAAIYQPSMSQLYARANDVVAGLLHLFNRWASVHSDLVTFDKSELLQLLGGGVVVMGAVSVDPASVTGPADVSKAVRDRLAGNVLADVDLATGAKAGCVTVAGAAVLDEFPSEVFEAPVAALDRMVGTARKGEGTVVHSGIYRGESEADSGLQVFTMVSGVDPPYARLSELARKGGVEARVVTSLADFLRV